MKFCCAAGDAFYRISIYYTAHDAEQNAAETSLDSLFRADRGNKLVFTQKHAGEICKGIGNPGADKGQKVDIFSHFHIPQKDNGNESGEHIGAGSKGNAHFIYRNPSIRKYCRGKQN